MPTRLHAALLLSLPLLMAALPSHSEEPRKLNLDASQSDLGLGGIKTWDFRLNMEAMLDPAESPERERTQPGTDPERHLNVDRFLLSGRTEHFRVRMGHHQAAREGLLFDGDTDWGLSATGELDSWNSDLSVFAVSTDPAPNTAREMKRSGDRPYYTGGVWQSTVPLPWSDTTLWAGYVNGGDTDTGLAAPNGVEASLQYRLGYSVGVRSALLSDRLNLEFESATSRFSMEGDSKDRRGSDNAYLASLRYQPELRLPFLDWEVGAETREVGSAFFSPGNRSMARARATRRLFLSFQPFDIGSLGYSYQQKEIGNGSHTLSSQGNQLFADLSLAPWDWLSLQPYGEFQQRQYPDLDASGHHSRFSLTADAWLIPDQLVYRNTIKLTRTDGPDGSFLVRDKQHQYVAGELQWQALSPTHNRSGLDVNLSFSADRHESPSYHSDGLNDYQVLLSISSNGDGASRIW